VCANPSVRGAVPREFPWTRFLPKEDVRAFVADLADAQAAVPLDDPAQVIGRWRHTAEVG
jgi:hypothetical protein